MFVPGVNGSVIPSAPSGSKLKGAYKNSKKRKMPNGGLTYLPYTKVQNQYTDTPSPKPVVKPRVGDTITPNYTKLYTDLGVDAGSLLPGYIGKSFDVVSKLRAAGDDDYNQGLEFVPGKKANIVSVANDIQKIINAKPYVYKGRQMPNGGSVLSMGDYDLTSAPKKGNYLLPDINRPSYRDSDGKRRSEYKMGFRDDSGKEVLIPTVVGGRQLSEDESINRYYQTGLHMGKFNTPQESDYAARLRTARYNMLEDPIRFNANQFKNGGEKSEDKEMVDGVAGILRGVKDKKNRLQLANKMAKQFNREKVSYNLSSFLKKSKVKR